METRERTVLHVLPHPGGGGETYVDLLDEMPGYRFTKVYLAPSPRPTPVELARGVVHALRRGRSHDLVHAHGEPAAGLSLPLLAGRPSLVTLNGLSLSRRLSGLTHGAAALNLRTVARAAGRTICVCQAERMYLEQIAGPAAARRAIVLHNGVRIPPPRDETHRLETRRELGLDAAAVVGIWVGALDVGKDPVAAIQAAQAASVPLLVVGDGPLRAQVERAAVGGNISVLGHRNDVPRLLDAADLFVFTSRHEGFSFSLLEAMAHRLPAVVTSLPENVEAISDTGLAIRVDDDSLASALRRLAENPGERTLLGEQAFQRVSRLFDATEMTRRTHAVYDGLLDGDPAATATIGAAAPFDASPRTTTVR